MSDLHFRTLSDVCRDIKSGALTSVDVTQRLLARVEQTQSRYRAYVTVMAEQALKQAEQRDRERADGRPLGGLHGVPIALKDLLFTKGIRTTCGTKVLNDFVPDETATVVHNLERAGAVIVGKVKLTEGAFSNHHPEVVPPLNPWGEHLWTGVSSSGSGVSVAAGLAYAAIGTDTGGSIRFPSASCGVVGIKPTYGRVSRYGVFPLADSLDHIGPMARCVEDCARMLAAMSGHDPKDPTSLPLPAPNYGRDVADGASSLQGVRVGFDAGYCEGGVETTVIRALHDTLTALADGGARRVDVQLPPCRELVDAWAVTCGVETALAHEAFYPKRRNDYGPALAGLIELGRRSTAMQYAALERHRERYRGGLEALFAAQVDVLIMPAMPTTVPTLNEADRRTRSDSQVAEMITFTAPSDYSGHPSITLPVGVHDGRPLAVQLIAGLQQEATLIKVASAWEKVLGGPMHYARAPE